MSKYYVRISLKILSLTLLFLLSLNSTINAQETDSLFDESSKTFVPIPIINNSPAMKTGVGAMLMYFFKFDKKDTISPPSNISLIGLYSTNKSYFVVPVARLFWDEDKNRSSVALGTINVNNNFLYDFEGNDIRLVYTENRKFLTLEYSRKIVGHFYLGLLYLGTKTSYKFDQGTDEENDFTREFFKKNEISNNFVSSIGMNISFDSRDYIYYPTSGLMYSVRPKLNAQWLGSENEYIDTDYKMVYFMPVLRKHVLGFSLSGGFAWGDVPFDGYQNYGIRNSLRGYPTGKYKGKNMIAFQTEYRWNFYERWGAVFFAGAGGIWGNDNNGEQAFERKFLPSAGLGARFMISRAKKINLRLDYALGVDGNQGVYFGVMEAF